MVEPITVLSLYEVDHGKMTRLRAAAPDVRVVHTPSLAAMQPHIADASVVLSMNFSDELLHQAKHLKWFQSVGAGINHLLTKDFVKSGVLLTNAKGNHTIPVSEHAFALLLGLTRRINLCYGENSILDRWDRVQGDELYGNTMGVLGIGNIGREIARKAQAFGMRVRGFDEVPVFLPYVDELYLGDQAEEFFTGLDALVVTAALTKATTGLVNRHHLSLMNKGSYVVNVSRGPLVVERDLIEALRDGSLRGAGLDVFDQEPLPRDSELRSLPNVILTPHTGGFNPKYQDRVLQLFVENFRRWTCDEPLINRVDLADVHWHDEGRS